METTAERRRGVDLVRGCAILCMVEVHAAAAFIEAGADRTSWLALLAASIGGLAAPLFITVSGWGSQRSAVARLERGEPGMWRWVGVRVGVLCAAQLVVNVLGHPWFDLWTPGVLTLLALCTLLTPLLARSGMIVRIPLLLALVAGPLLLGTWAEPDLTFAGRVAQASFAEWLSRLLISGTYPLLPWLAFFVLGGLLDEVGWRGRAMWMMFACAATVLTMGAAIGTSYDWALTSASDGKALLTFFPASTFFLVGAGAGVLLIWNGIDVLTQRPPSERFAWLTTSLDAAGRRSLTIYVVHFALLGPIVTDLLGWKGAFGVGPALLLTLAFTAMWLPLAVAHAIWLRGWDLESLLRRLSPPATTPAVAAEDE